LKKALGVKLVYDAHEVFGYMIARDIPQWWADRFLRKEREMAPKADHVITVAEPHLEHFKKMGCRNVTLVRNCKHLTENEYRPTNNKVFTLVYIGGLNRSRFLVEAAEVCKGINGMAFRVAGFGQAESELRLLADQNPGRIEFLGKIPMERVVPETQRGDVILCMFDPSNLNNKIGPPNKIFEAMVAGRPVIATKDTYSGGLVVENGMGLAVGFDKQGLKEALVELKDNPGVVQGMGKNALKAASGEFNWTVQENRLLNVYKTLGGSA
jgi:glycosyltransferase involved in cell wall biosynthesis